MPNEFKVRNGLVVDSGGAQITGSSLLTGSLTVTGSAFISSSNATQLQVGSGLLFVNSSGNVGIGDTSPARRLVVNRGSVGDVAQFYGGVQSMYIYSSNNSVSFSDGVNTAGNSIGFSSAAGDGVSISTNSFGPRLSISSTSFYVLPPSSFASNVTITGSASNSLRVKGSGATSATNALYVENSSGTQALTVRDDGLIRIGETATDLQISPSLSRIIFASPSSNGLIGYSSYNTFLTPTELRLFSGTAMAGYTNALGDFRFYNSSTAKTYMYISDTGNIGINKGTVTPNAELDVSGSVVITGSLTVITGSNIEFQVLNTGVKIGNVVGDIHTVTGSLRVSGSITGSLQGTASAAQTIISRYVCQGKLNADQSIATNNDVIIQFIDDFDPNNWYNAGTYQFLPTVAGYYSISVGVWFDNTTDTNNQMNIQARKNGNSFALVQSPTNGATGQSLTFTKMVYLNGSTDYIDFTAYQSTGGSVNIQQGTADGSGTWFSAFLIST